MVELNSNQVDGNQKKKGKQKNRFKIWSSANRLRMTRSNNSMRNIHFLFLIEKQFFFSPLTLRQHLMMRFHFKQSQQHQQTVRSNQLSSSLINSMSNNSINNVQPIAQIQPEIISENITQNAGNIEMDINLENKVNDATSSNDQFSNTGSDNYQFLAPINQTANSSILPQPISAQISEENSLSASNSELNLNSL